MKGCDIMKKELVSLPDAEFEVMDAVWSCEKEFAPIKNKTGVDSVESAKELLKLNGVEL